MRILLANPPVQYLHTTTFLLPSIPPVGLLSLAAVARRHGDVRVVDSARALLERDAALREAAAFNPDVIAVSVHFPPDGPAACALIEALDEALPGCTIVAGGPVPTFLPEPFLRAGARHVVLGEGEQTFDELLEAIGSDPARAGEVPGTCHLNHDEGTVFAAPREQLAQLDPLPLLPMDLIPPYPAVSHRGRAAAMETVRGCPFTCEFCSTPAFWKTVRYFSNDRILEQIDDFHHMGVTEVFFVDDLFGSRRDKYVDLLLRIVARGYPMRFGGCMRADLVVRWPDLTRLLGEAGFYLINVGFEEYRPEVLEAIGKRSSAEANRAAARALRRLGITVLGSHVFGVPGESVPQMLRSVGGGIRNSDLFRLSMYTPDFGSPLYDRLVSEGTSFRDDLQRQSYWHYNFEDGRSPAGLQTLFFLSQLAYYSSPRTVLDGLGLRGRAQGRLTRRAYYSAAMFTLFGGLRRAGVRLL